MTAYVSIPTFRRPKSRQKGSAHGTGQAVSPFVQELPSAISFSRLNLVTNNFSSFARGETVRPPLEMSDTKSFTFFLAKDGYWLCPLRCRMFLMLPLLQYPIAKVTFKELQHCQNHRQRPQRGAEKMYKFSDVPLARPNLHIPRLSRGSCRQGAADRGIFSFSKIREQRLWRLILSVLCLFVPFWAPKRKDRKLLP